MKKFLAMFLALTLLFSFAACNKDDTSDNDKETISGQGTEQTTGNEEDTTNKKPEEEKTTAEPFENPNVTEPKALFKIIDADDYELKSRKPNTMASSGITTISERYEIKNAVANDVPDNVSIGEAKVTLNKSTVKEFIAQGWTIASKNDANTAIEAGEETNVFLQNNKEEAVKFVVKNKTANSIALADCTIVGVGVTKTLTQKTWADFELDGKANSLDSTYEDYIKAFGYPASVNVVEFYQGKDLTHCKATLNFEKTVGSEIWTISVVFEDVNGKLKIENCIIEVK